MSEGGDVAGTRRPEDGPSADVAGAATVTDVVQEALSDRPKPVRRTRSTRVAAEPIAPHPSAQERHHRGRLARAETPRSRVAVWTPPAHRADPVQLLAEQEAARVQELVPVRHARMATSAFAFFRGAALVMAADLAAMPRTPLTVQLCGDAHLSNFGLFGAPDRSVVFDLNDFDETNPGPFEWDVKRLATSFVLAGRDNHLPGAAGSAAAEATATSYRQSVAMFATRGELEIWYDRVDVSELVAEVAAQPGAKVRRGAKGEARAEAVIEDAVAKARMRDAWSAIEKITEVVDGRRRFRDQPPLLTRVPLDADTAGAVNELFHEYRGTLQDDRQALLRRYEIVDMGHKVVGVGSVGLLAWVLLLRGRDEHDLMVLQVKQAEASVLEAFTRRSAYSKHGHRVVAGQRLMQAASDSFLGWVDGPAGRSFYVRQLRDMKWSPEPSSLDAEWLRRYAVLCGHALARAHARSGDAIAISAYLGSGRSFDRAIRAFAESYADQAERDYAAFTAAVVEGRVTAHEDPGGAESSAATLGFGARPASTRRVSGRTTRT